LNLFDAQSMKNEKFALALAIPSGSNSAVTGEIAVSGASVHPSHAWREGLTRWAPLVLLQSQGNKAIMTDHVPAG